MFARDDNPRWLAALLAAVPVAAGAVLVLLFPPEPRAVPALPARAVPVARAAEPAAVPEPDLLARNR